MGILRKLFPSKTTDILDILTAQHGDVDELIARLENGEGDRRSTFVLLADHLAAHAAAEEKVFYPAVMAKEVEDMLRESVEEHLSIKRMLADLIEMRLDEATFRAKLKVLREHISHHAHDEEEDKLFPAVKKLMTADELAAIGNEYLVEFEALLEQHASKHVPAETDAAAELPSV